MAVESMFYILQKKIGCEWSAYIPPIASRMSPNAGSMLTLKSMISPRSTKYDSRKSTKSLAPIPVMPMTKPSPVPIGACKRTCHTEERAASQRIVGLSLARQGEVPFSSETSLLT